MKIYSFSIDSRNTTEYQTRRNMKHLGGTITVAEENRGGSLCFFGGESTSLNISIAAHSGTPNHYRL